MLDLMWRERTFCQFYKRSHESTLEAVLPKFWAHLLQQGDQKVDGLSDVLDDFLIAHVHVTDSDTQGQNLLHLELDCSTDLPDLRFEAFVVSDGGRKLSCLVKPRPQNTRNLLNQSRGCNECIVLLSWIKTQLEATTARTNCEITNKASSQASCFS